MTAMVICAAIATLALVASVVAVVRIRTRRRRRSSTPQVTLHYRSGTTVTLEASEVRRRADSASPPIRRRLPGLMPTAGYTVVPSTRAKRPSLAKMDFDVS